MIETADTEPLTDQELANITTLIDHPEWAQEWSGRSMDILNDLSDLLNTRTHVVHVVDVLRTLRPLIERANIKALPVSTKKHSDKWTCANCLTTHCSEPSRLVVVDRRYLSARIGTQQSVDHFLCLLCAKQFEEGLGVSKAPALYETPQ